MNAEDFRAYGKGPNIYVGMETRAILDEAAIEIERLQAQLEQAKAVILTYQRLAREAQLALQPVMEQLARSLPPEAMR